MTTQLQSVKVVTLIYVCMCVVGSHLINWKPMRARTQISQVRNFALKLALIPAWVAACPVRFRLLPLPQLWEAAHEPALAG